MQVAWRIGGHKPRRLFPGQIHHIDPRLEIRFPVVGYSQHGAVGREHMVIVAAPAESGIQNPGNQCISNGKMFPVHAGCRSDPINTAAGIVKQVCFPPEEGRFDIFAEPCNFLCAAGNRVQQFQYTDSL